MPRPSHVQEHLFAEPAPVTGKVDEGLTIFESSVHSSESDTNTNTVQEPEEESRTETLPTAGTRKSYSFIEDDELAPTKEKDEQDDEPTGTIPRPDLFRRVSMGRSSSLIIVAALPKCPAV